MSGKFDFNLIHLLGKLAEKPDVFDVVSRNIAPSIFGSEDIKKSIACMLFGGSR